MPRTRPAPYVEVSPDYRRDKLENAILYFLSKADDPTLGKTKLMKLLYFADFDHYERHEVPLTGATYFRLDEGPVPKVAFDLLEKLQSRGSITMTPIKMGTHLQHRYQAKAEPRVDLFSDTELQTLDDVVQRWAKTRSSEIVAATHDEAPWLAVANNREIPYFLAFYRNNYGEMDLEDDELN